ncbi:MAG: tRNA uridine-5-carboxymethylaminomethyl(34) synthesis enzyme MnmG [Marinilabiliaceae bacterium]|nr:tRNA uridine-5-carboxymethylaminomethyl(34) synthesis enzyme MnmG [Marinilabiliaceae bacterium]
MTFHFDVIVVGAGHAGCEAAHAAATLGSSTLLITMDLTKIAQMSCNPAVGGIAKGQIVRDIDALGGLMGEITDKTSIHFKMLNKSKGPAMWSPRSQCDKVSFSLNWIKSLENTTNLSIWQDSVTELIIEKGEIGGVKTKLGVSFFSKSVILTNGTFLNGLIHIGRIKYSGGRMGDEASFGLSNQMLSLGFNVGRMKTGTPVRIDGRTINFEVLEHQESDEDKHHKFSFYSESNHFLEQRHNYICYTSTEVHDILKSGFSDSPLYNGTIKSIGPRYCPSIETKLVNFPDKSQHQLFLEPESLSNNEYYLNGFSSSLPLDVQIKALNCIKGLENAQIIRPGYAIEYDFFDPTQLTLSLESSLVHGLFLAGQINGTTGYEEAAGQGLIAGINAHNYCNSKPYLILSRDQSYIGVLIDDLINKGVDEPYRMFTSRAEHRILLRQDNSDFRLTQLGIDIGLVSDKQKTLFAEKQLKLSKLLEHVYKFKVKPDNINNWLNSIKSSALTEPKSISDLLIRPEISIFSLIENNKDLIKLSCSSEQLKYEILEELEVLVKYAGYIKREKEHVDSSAKSDSIVLKDKIDYSIVSALSFESREKLTKHKPATIGQAKRIPGVSTADIDILITLLHS